MATLSVFLNDTIDLTDLVHSRPSIVEELPLFGQLMVGGITSINFVNKWGWLDYNNPASPFYGYTDFSDFEISVYSNEDLISKGFVDQISKDGNTGVIQLEPTLQRLLSQKCVFASDEVSNPARIFRRVCAFYGIPYDSDSVNNSESVYELDEIRTSAYLLDPTMDVASLFQSLCTVGIARIYSRNNMLYFDVYQDIDLVPIVTIESDVSNSYDYLITRPLIASLPSDVLDGYSVETTEGTASYRKDAKSVSISGGNNSAVRINALNAGVWIGERHIEYSNAPIKTAEFVVPTQTIGQELQIGYPVRVIDTETLESLDVEIKYKEQPDTVTTRLIGQTR